MEGIFKGADTFHRDAAPQILSALSKATSRRIKAAFAKIGAALLVEVGIHNPLAAEIGREDEREMPLAKRFLSRLPKKSLLLADRYYGVGSFLSEFLALLRDVSCVFLVRVCSQQLAQSHRQL